ncbi:MAG: peptidoglycan-binding domain-containing protein [Roseiarcus sp.]|jgi:hypothetical protein
MRHDSVLSSPARSGPPKGRFGLIAAAIRRLRAMPARGYAGAALAAVLTGIVVNALTLQHERHPAPFFAARPSIVGAPAPAAAPPPQAAKADESAGVAVLPPARPANLGAAEPAAGVRTVAEPAAGARGAVEPAASARGADAIGDILRADSAKDAEKQVLAAQNALIKLGYVLKADGSPGAATSAALRDFERAHSLPISTEITPRLLKQLTAALDAAAQ